MMINLFKRRFHKGHIWMLFVLLFVNACQPASTVSPSTQPTSTQIPIIEPTSTETVILSPTFELPKATPVSTEVTSMLTLIGPWLTYVHNSPRPGFADSMPVAAEFVLLNQDGSGRTLITLPECDVNAFLKDGANSVNYMIQHDGGLYLFRPSQGTAMLVYRRLWYSLCNTFFSGDERGGLLASIYYPADTAPELIIYELPAGKIRDRFPLVRCGEAVKVCERFRSNWAEMGAQEPQWSPNGRYLAFAAVIDAGSSDLFVYDSQDGSLRRLTNGPDWVGPIDWSPDGTQIIMQEILNEVDFFFGPSSTAPSSVWSVSVSTNDIKLLYPTNGASDRQNILVWLNDNRFVAYAGFRVNVDQAYSLRLVDLESGTNRILFDGAFGTISFDPIHQTFVVYALYGEPYPWGNYLVSIKNDTIRPLEGSQSFPEWDKNTGLFLSNDTCENEPNRFQAFDYQGNLHCIPAPLPTPDPSEVDIYPSPDGKWTVSVKDGLWLETEGSAAVRLNQKIPSDVIWCPNSNCFFFSEFQPNPQQKNLWTLYRVSLPDLTIKTVDEGIQSTGSYQWLGVEK